MPKEYQPTILEESLKGPFLTLITEGVNNHYIMICPEFEVSACGYSQADVLSDLYDIIKVRSSSILLKKEKNKEVPVHLLKYSEKVAEALNSGKDISSLFKS